ncbi:hypothetical protein DV736_g6681, partial [Chaetothyriales sp. CBS 134916]
MRTWLFEPAAVRTSGSPAYSLSLHPVGRPELRAWSFFREQTSPILSSFSKFTVKFFYELVPLLSEAESSVKQTAIALATNQELASCAPSNVYDLLLVRSNSFSSALNALTEPQCNLVAILMCALLLVGYENFRDPGNSANNAMTHLGSGLRILDEYEATNRMPRTDSAYEAIRLYLEPMYLQMEMFLSIFRTPITIHRNSAALVGAERPAMPSCFRDLSSARTLFFRICWWHWHLRADHLEDWTSRSAAFLAVRDTFLQWNSLLMLYSDTLSATEMTQKRRVLSMVSHSRLFMTALVHSASSSSPPVLGSNQTSAPPAPLHRGRIKTSLVDIFDPDAIVVTFIIDPRSLTMLEICDWTDSGLLCDPALRIWPTAEVRKFEDGRGLVKL